VELLFPPRRHVAAVSALYLYADVWRIRARRLLAIGRPFGEPDRDKGELPVAYVQLRPGMSTTESELLAHCRREISEAAATPRQVRIIEAMPVTAVGKIFKPALRRDATERCVRRVMSQIGLCESVTMNVTEHGGGFCVVLRSEEPNRGELVNRIRCALEHYAFRVEVSPTSDMGDVST
jgi:fatty-acyl-CoA synthase